MQKTDQELYDDLFVTAKSLISRSAETDTIEKHLLQKTDDIILITVVIKEARNLHYAALRKEGFKLVGIGAVLVFLGFLITFLNWDSNRSFIVVMYGCTSIGASIVFYGLYKIIG